MQPEERDVHVLTLRERLAGTGPLTDRIKAHGTGECLECGGPTVPGRVQCSKRCRSAASRRGGVQVTADGVTASIAIHLRRLGLSKGAFYARLRAGASVVEALTREPDKEMRRRAACRTGS